MKLNRFTTTIAFSLVILCIFMCFYQVETKKTVEVDDDDEVVEKKVKKSKKSQAEPDDYDFLDKPKPKKAKQAKKAETEVEEEVEVDVVVKKSKKAKVKKPKDDDDTPDEKPKKVKRVEIEEDDVDDKVPKKKTKKLKTVEEDSETESDPPPKQKNTPAAPPAPTTPNEPKPFDIGAIFEKYTNCQNHKATLNPSTFLGASEAATPCLLQFKDFYCVAICTAYKFDQIIDRSTSKYNLPFLKKLMDDAQSQVPEESRLQILNGVDRCQRDLAFPEPVSGGLLGSSPVCVEYKQFYDCFEPKYDKICGSIPVKKE